MVLLTQLDRQELKMASSGLDPEKFCRLPDETRDQYTANLDKVILNIAKRNPGAFKLKAILDHKATIKRQERASA